MDVAHPRRAPTRRTRSIDLDPGTATTWDELLTLARLHRTALEHLGVRGYPKTSGQRGIQIWIPIEPRMTFDETRAWVERLSRAVARRRARARQRRMGEAQPARARARLDYTQNAINKTLVAPYSVRAGAGCAGLDADHVGRARRPGAAADRWTIRDAAARLAEVGDLSAADAARPAALAALV